MPRQDRLPLRRQNEPCEALRGFRRAIHHGEPVIRTNRERLRQCHDLLGGIFPHRDRGGVR